MNAASQNLANGNLIIILYDFFILCLFLMELFLYRNQDHYRDQLKEKQKIRPIRLFLLKIAINYQRRGVLTVTGILFIISLVVVNNHHLIEFPELIGISISFIVFILIIFVAQKLLIRMDRFQDDIVSRYVDLILYLILGHWFVLAANFIKPPTLPLGLIGLGFALLLTFSVMVQAIANPASIRSSVSKRRKYQETTSILKGMLLLIFCELAILYLMIYNCFKISPEFYYSSINRAIDAFDMLYYLIVSFATIGYGDIYPIRFNGQIYAEVVAIFIGLSSMFSTACFVAAVVAGAGNIGRQEKKDQSLQADEKIDLIKKINQE